jgi:hypothetical protein
MQVNLNKVVSVHYKLHVHEGNSANEEFVEETQSNEPMVFLFGSGNLLPAFENNLQGLTEGGTFDFSLTPDQGYGNSTPENVVKLPMEAFVAEGEELDREMINPGYIQPTAFYNTTNPAQSKFSWASKGPQFTSGNPAQPFDARAYNQGAGSATPFGLGQIAAPLSPEEIQAAIAGTYQQRPGTPAATRVEAYSPNTMPVPQYGQVQVGGPTAPIAPTTTPRGSTKELYTKDQKATITASLGPNWQKELDTAALNGDYATIVRIQNQINAILNPVAEQA